MADTYGAPALPLPLPIPLPGGGAAEVTDPAITLVGQFVQAVLNTYGQAAYTAVNPPVSGLVSGGGVLTEPVCRTAFGHDPATEEFKEDDLPAVYVWRQGGERPYWLAEDYRVLDDTWTVLWIFEPAPQATRTLIHSFVSGVVKIVDALLEKQRDPSYVAPWDTDPTAATTLAVADAIKTAVASSLTAQTYTGAALNGAIGGAAFVPPQLPTVTITGTGGAGTVEFTGIGADGNPRVSRVDVAGVGTFSGDFGLTEITEIDVPAQADTGATFTFGLGGFQGLGTNVLVLGSFLKIEVAKWRQYPWKLPMGDTSPERTYPHALEITLTTQERWIRDIAGFAPDEVQTQIPTVGGDNTDVRETSLFT